MMIEGGGRLDGTGLKALWKAGGRSFGTWITFTDPAVAAFIAGMGFDFVVVDGEHSPFNPETLRSLILTLTEGGVVPLVRVRSLDEGLVKQVLDWGAEGVVFPFIRTAEEARRAVAACRYPPLGIRGFSPREASHFWKDLDRYVATANERIVTVVQVEHIDAVKSIEAILQVPGIDGLLIGPADLSFSLGVPLEQNHPIVQEAINHAIRMANLARVPIGMAWYDTAEGYADYIARGLDWVLLGDDSYFMTTGGTALLEGVRRAVGLSKP